MKDIDESLYWHYITGNRYSYLDTVQRDLPAIGLPVVLYYTNVCGERAAKIGKLKRTVEKFYGDNVDFYVWSIMNKGKWSLLEGEVYAWQYVPYNVHTGAGVESLTPPPYKEKEK